MLSIIIPARNESDNLEDILNYFKNGMGTINYEVILINDFSEDNTFEKAKAPKEVEEFFSHLDDVPPRKAVFVMMDGTVTDPVGPKDLATAANEADGAIAIIYNGTISDKTLDIASEAAIETVVGTKKGKGYG